MPDIRVINPVTPLSGHIDASARRRVAAYCRVSSDSDDQLASYTTQVEHYTNLINDNGAWELVDIYADEGLTGTRADIRPDFQRLMKDCRRGKIDKILIKSISRFARNAKDCLTSIRELKSLGVEVFFERENIDTGAVTGEMLLSLYSSMAQEESISISANMRWSYKRRMKSGQFITCTAPYGYRLLDGNLIIEESEAEVVRQIFNSYLSGDGAHVIAEKLTGEGIPNGHGNTAWAYSTICYMLNNEKYIGDALLQKSYVPDSFPFTRRPNNGEQDKFYVENAHPGIISRDNYSKARTLSMLKKKQIEEVPASCQYPFSKMIVCGHCGRTFKRVITRGLTYWVCYNHYESKYNCPIRQIPEPVLQVAFIRLWDKLRANRHDILLPMLEQLEASRSQSVRQNKRVGEIDLQVNELGQQILVLNRLRSKGYMDAAMFTEQSNTVNQTINALRTERRRLLDDEDDTTIETTKRLYDILSRSPDRLDAFNEHCFAGIIEKMIVQSQEAVAFRLINGLDLTESIEITRR